MTYTVTIEEDPVTGDLILPIPQELMDQVGWSVNDQLHWQQNADKSFTLTKIVDLNNLSE